MAVAKLAWHGRERLVLLRVRDGALVAHVLKWDDEVRDPSELAPQDITVTDSEIDEALLLVDSMTTDDISGYRDEYRQALEAVHGAKAEGRQPPKPSTVAEEPGGKVVDLMAALEESVRKAQAARGEGAGDVYCHRVTTATRQFAVHVLTSDRQVRDLLGNLLLQIHHGQGMTCVLDPAQALCRLRGTIDDPLVTPDIDDYRPQCRNIARTDRDVQLIRHHHRELAAAAVVAAPLAPPIRHERERHELQRLQRILDTHEAENHL